MSMALYGVGYLVVLVGVLYIAHLMHIPQNWMIGIGLVLLGLGITTAVQNTRQKDPN